MADLPDLAVLDMLPDAVVVVAPDGTVVGCSSRAARLLRTTSAAVVGRPAPQALPLSDEAGLDFWTCTRPLEGDPRLLPRLSLRDLELRAGDGRPRPVSLTASRVADASGNLAHLFVVLRDGQKRRRLDAGRSDLVATVSHEIRSPLTSVKGFTKTLLSKWERFTDAQKRHMLATIDEDADRVTRLLGELLDVSRIDAGRLQLRRQMVDVPAVAQRVAGRLTRDDGRAIVTDFSDVPQLYADPDKLEQVFTNLVENALNYGGGEIRVSAVTATDLVTFSVRDHGDGIDTRHLVHIFTKFFRRAGERRTGTGLGLYITKGIVEAHGGRIWADSAPGAGACFSFTLPRGGLELAGIDVPRSLPQR